MISGCSYATVMYQLRACLLNAQEKRPVTCLDARYKKSRSVARVSSTPGLSTLMTTSFLLSLSTATEHSSSHWADIAPLTAEDCRRAMAPQLFKQPRRFSCSGAQCFGEHPSVGDTRSVRMEATVLETMQTSAKASVPARALRQRGPGQRNRPH